MNTSPAREGPWSSTVPPAASEPTSGSGPTKRSPSSPTSRSIYSPSETSAWLTCPVWRDNFYKRKRLPGEDTPKKWAAREVDWDPARLLGIAVQAGVNVWLGAGSPQEDEADPFIEEKVERILSDGFQEQPRYTKEGLAKIVYRGIDAVRAKGIFDRHRILMIDEPLSQSRPDVVSRHEVDGLGVTDFKVSHHVDERYRDKRLSEYETDDQFWHYAWEVGETLGEPVKWVRVVLVILTPKVVVLTETTTVTPERLNFWLQGAEQHWQDMSAEDRGERVIAPRWPSCRGGKFGVCEAYDFCHVFHRDPSKATVYYERVE